MGPSCGASVADRSTLFAVVALAKQTHRADHLQECPFRKRSVVVNLKSFDEIQRLGEDSCPWQPVGNWRRAFGCELCQATCRGRSRRVRYVVYRRDNFRPRDEGGHWSRTL